MDEKKSNIVLIGMAGCGKSTTGPILAGKLAKDFIDTDDLIASAAKCSLQKIINNQGLEVFRTLEERILCGLDVCHHVVATGGSAIYSSSGMTHLRKSGLLIYLALPLTTLTERIDNIASRGLVKTKKQSFTEVFQERKPLYEKWADITVNCLDKTVNEICREMIESLERMQV